MLRGVNFYKRFIGDYQRDTGHLSMTEHGAYTLLLDTYYATGKPLPSDQVQIHRIIRAVSDDEKMAVSSILQQFWTETRHGWTNNRASIEIKKSKDFSEMQSKRVKGRYRNPTEPTPDAHPKATSHSHSQKEDLSLSKKKERSSSAAKEEKEPDLDAQIAEAEHALATSREIGHSTDVIKLERRLQKAAGEAGRHQNVPAQPE